jgi:hypothetical protein
MLDMATTHPSYERREKRQLKYLGGLAKNCQVTVNVQENIPQMLRLDELAQALSTEAFAEVQLHLDKPKTLWVATKEVEISQLKGKRSIAIIMNAATFSQATEARLFPY